MLFERDGNEMEINLIDRGFSHLSLPRGMCGKVPTQFKWVRNKSAYEGITVYTDKMISHENVRRFAGKYKVAWLIEPPTSPGSAYKRIIPLEKLFDEVWTYDVNLLKRNPEKYKFCIHGGAWSNESLLDVTAHKKTIPLSMIFSQSNTTPGHRLRHTIHKVLSQSDIGEKIIFGGSGCGLRLPHHPSGHGISSGAREKLFLDSLFTIVVESNYKENYFTEKLVDPLLLKTIPIYWGCPNIGEFFDVRGIIIFENSSHLCEIARKILLDPRAVYDKYLPYTQINYTRAKKYMIPEDWFHAHLLSARKNE